MSPPFQLQEPNLFGRGAGGLEDRGPAGDFGHHKSAVMSIRPRSGGHELRPQPAQCRERHTSCRFGRPGGVGECRSLVERRVVETIVSVASGRRGFSSRPKRAALCRVIALLGQFPHHLDQVRLALEPDTGQIRHDDVAVFDPNAVGEAAVGLEQVRIAFIAAQS
jgi:hypothetical protein